MPGRQPLRPPARPCAPRGAPGSARSRQLGWVHARRGAGPARVRRDRWAGAGEETGRAAAAPAAHGRAATRSAAGRAARPFRRPAGRLRRGRAPAAGVARRAASAFTGGAGTKSSVSRNASNASKSSSLGVGPRIVVSNDFRNEASKLFCQPCQVHGPVRVTPRRLKTFLRFSYRPSLSVSNKPPLVCPSV